MFAYLVALGSLCETHTRVFSIGEKTVRVVACSVLVEMTCFFPVAGEILVGSPAGESTVQAEYS